MDSGGHKKTTTNFPKGLILGCPRKLVLNGLFHLHIFMEYIGVISYNPLILTGHPSTLDLPPPSNSHHQDYYIFSRESP